MTTWRDGGQCPVCGGIGVREVVVLDDALVRAWELTASEAALINRQQGESCVGCGANLRSRTLAAALLIWLRSEQTLQALTAVKPPAMRLLEINGAGALTPWLSRWPGYQQRSFPAFDMQKMSVPDAALDIVVHSDTLEHLPDPIAGLRECRRVLRPGGVMLFTIPVVPTRLTRRRTGLTPAYHGAPGEEREDWRVVTEYGADFYLDLLAAGWRQFSIHTLGTSASMAVTAVI